MARRHPRPAPPPLRATSMWRVDQVFLQYKGGRVEVTSSLVNDRGDLRNLAHVAPTSDPVQAVRQAAREVAGRGNVFRAHGARVRWAREVAVNQQNELIRDHDLEDAYLDAFEETLGEIRDRLR